MKNLITTQILKNLNNIINTENLEFNENFKKFKKKASLKLENVNFDKYINLLKYVHFILDNSVFKNPHEFHQIHIHFQIDHDELENVVAAYLIIYYNYKLRNLDVDSKVNSIFLDFKSDLREYIESPIHLNGTENKRRINELRLKRKLLRLKKDDCELILNNVTFKNKVLCNTSTSIFNLLDFSDSSNLSCKISSFTEEIQDFYSHPFYHFYINENIDVKTLGRNYKVFIENLEHIILFEKSNRVNYIDYSNKNLERYLKRFYKLKSYLNVSFDKEHKQYSLSYLENKLFNFQHKYNLDKGVSYIISNSEINFLLNDNQLNLESVVRQSYGEFEDDLCIDFFHLCRSYDLNELRSTKFHNILNSVINVDIKEYLIHQLFENPDSKLLSEDTKFLLHNDIQVADLNALKISLNRLLDYAIKFYENFDFSLIDNLVLENALYNDVNFIKKLNINDSVRIISNYELASNFNELTGIFYTFCYRNRGSRIYNFYPNSMEQYPNPNLKIIYICNNAINKLLIDELEYKFHKDFYRIIKHPIRDNYFDFNSLKKTIKQIKPNENIILSYDLENIYSNYSSSQRYTITYREDGVNILRSLTRPKTDYAIVKDKNLRSFSIVAFDEILGRHVNSFVFDFLDKILEELDLFTLFNKKSEDNVYLNTLSMEYNIGDVNGLFLWKYLLIKKSNRIGPENLLKILREKLDSNIVSDNHFYNKWLNLDSDMISPRSKNIFRKLCKYLELPDRYVFSVLRYKLAQVGSSREKNKFLEDVAIQLIHYKCFDELDEEMTYREIIKRNINSLRDSYDFESFGISEDLVSTFLELMVTEIESKLQLKQFVSIENRQN